MKKIDLEDYLVTVVGEDGKKLQVPFQMKKSIVNILFHPQLNLDSKGIYEHDKIAIKVEECKEKCVLLEDSEYEKLKRAIETFKGYTRDNKTFLDRIIYAENVSVQEKKE